MTTLEKIRATLKQDLENAKKDYYELGEEFDNGYVCGLEIALKVIDKYASEECEHDCEHCAYLECPIEPSDLIRRTDMLDAVGHGTTYTTEHLQKIINGLPSVNPVPYEDAVSRQAVIDLIRECFPTEEQTTGWLMVEGIMALPSVQPKGDTIQLLEQAIRDIKQAENRIKGGAE